MPRLPSRSSPRTLDAMSKSLNRIKAALAEAGVACNVLEMDGETRTAADAAREAGCEIDQIAKSIIFRGETTGEAVLFITAGGNQVDPARASALAGEPLGRADAAFVREKTGFAIGGPARLLRSPAVRVRHGFCRRRDAEAHFPHRARRSSAALVRTSSAVCCLISADFLNFFQCVAK